MVAEIITSPENLGRNELVPVIQKDVWENLMRRTKEHANNGVEFKYFLLGKNGIATKGVEVGIGTGYRHGMSIDPQEVVNQLAPFLYDQGYEVIAEYHNHQPENLHDYELERLPREYALTPSESDIDNPIGRMVQLMNNNKPFAKIIGAYDPYVGKVITSAYVSLQQEIPHDLANEVTFSQLTVDLAEDELGVDLPSVTYTNPEGLVKHKIIKFVYLETTIGPSDKGVVTQENPIQQTIETRKLAETIDITDQNVLTQAEWTADVVESIIQEASDPNIMAEHKPISFYEPGTTIPQHIFDRVMAIAARLGSDLKLTQAQVFQQLCKLYHPDHIPQGNDQAINLANEYLRGVLNMRKFGYFRGLSTT